MMKPAQKIQDTRHLIPSGGRGSILSTPSCFQSKDLDAQIGRDWKNAQRKVINPLRNRVLALDFCRGELSPAHFNCLNSLGDGVSANHISVSEEIAIPFKCDANELGAGAHRVFGEKLLDRILDSAF